MPVKPFSISHIASAKSEEDYMDWLPLSKSELNHIFEEKPCKPIKLKCISNDDNTKVYNFEIGQFVDSPMIPHQLLDSSRYSWYRWGYTD